MMIKRYERAAALIISISLVLCGLPALTMADVSNITTLPVIMDDSAENEVGDICEITVRFELEGGGTAAPSFQTSVRKNQEIDMTVPLPELNGYTPKVSQDAAGVLFVSADGRKMRIHAKTDQSLCLTVIYTRTEAEAIGPDAPLPKQVSSADPVSVTIEVDAPEKVRIGSTITLTAHVTGIDDTAYTL